MVKLLFKGKNRPVAIPLHLRYDAAHGLLLLRVLTRAPLQKVFQDIFLGALIQIDDLHKLPLFRVDNGAQFFDQCSDPFVFHPHADLVYDHAGG